MNATVSGNSCYEFWNAYSQTNFQSPKKTTLFLLVVLPVTFSQSNLANEIDKNNQETSNKKFQELIKKVRNKALSYTDNLPNFICRQTTKRYVHTLGRGRGWLQTNRK